MAANKTCASVGLMDTPCAPSAKASACLSEEALEPFRSLIDDDALTMGTNVVCRDNEGEGDASDWNGFGREREREGSETTIAVALSHKCIDTTEETTSISEGARDGMSLSSFLDESGCVGGDASATTHLVFIILLHDGVGQLLQSFCCVWSERVAEEGGRDRVWQTAERVWL